MLPNIHFIHSKYEVKFLTSKAFGTLFTMTAALEELSSSDPVKVREWLQHQQPKSLALFDKFLMELRLGRLSQSAGQPSSSNDRMLLTRRTVELIKHLIGSTRWKSAAQLLCLLRGLGRELYATGGVRDPAIGNVIRRIMAAVREEAEAQPDQQQGSQQNSSGLAAKPETGRLSLQNMLWALPQHVKGSPSIKAVDGIDRQSQRTGSFCEADLKSEYPPSYYLEKPDLKHSLMEAIQEMVSDLEDNYRNINEQATQHIHAGEVIMTYGKSKTVELFLKAAAKKRKFQVIVCEGAPHYGGHEMARSLAEAKIDCVVIHDSATFAMMARVNKVVLPAHAVLANGGLIANSGCNMVALAAHHNSVPVVCATGLFKLCPRYPHEGQDTLNDLLSPSSVLDYTTVISDPLLADVELVNPVHDYIEPEYISLYICNVGSFQPSFIYRVLAEYYHTDDWESFEC